MTDRDEQLGVLRFGSFELDPANSELRKAGALIKLQSQHFQLLLLLATRSGQIVSREDIRQSLWGDRTFVDFDRSINFCISQIRSALNDDPQSPRYIETVPRRGYRFIAPVEGHSENGGLGQSQAMPKPRRSTRWLLGSAILIAAALVLLVANPRGWRNWLVRPSTGPIKSLAVLPLENLSGDPEQDYFAEGMTDELITALAKNSTLRVVSRTSVTPYKGAKRSLQEIARELNVDAVLEGTVLRERDRVRITTQLIRVSPEEHLWAEKYEGSLVQVLTLQDSVAQAVARSIQGKFSSQQRTVLPAGRSANQTVNPEAYEAYLKGRYFWARSSEENLDKCQQYFQEAVDKDPGYAPALAMLGSSYAIRAAYGVIPRPEAYARARTIAERALKLDDTLVEPLLTLARIKTEYEWDWAGAKQLYKRAIELNPNDGGAHQNYAVLLAAVGRPLEALAEAQRAHQAEPLNHVFNTNVAWFHYVAHQYDQAERWCNDSVEMGPSISWSHVCLGSVYLQTGRQRQAITELRRAADLSNRSVMELMYLGHALGVSGDRAGAQKILDELHKLSVRKYVPPEYIAVVYEGLGDTDRAFEWLEKGYAQRSMQSWVYPDPRQDPFRSDPRFKSIMRRMGLQQ